MKLVARKKSFEQYCCYKTTVDRAQRQGSVIGVCPVWHCVHHDQGCRDTFLKKKLGFYVFYKKPKNLKSYVFSFLCSSQNFSFFYVKLCKFI